MELTIGTHKINPNILRSKGAKSAAVLGLFITGVITGACGRDPFYQGSDAYYREVDPAFTAAEDNAARNRTYATQTAQAQESNNTQTNSQESSVENNGGLCDFVPEGGNVSQTVQEANGGVFPPYKYGDTSVYVSLVHNGEIKIARLSDIMDPNNPVNKIFKDASGGDRVCVDNTHTKPIPTPQSSVPSQKARAFRNNGFSPNKGSQAARPLPIRRG